MWFLSFEELRLVTFYVLYSDLSTVDWNIGSCRSHLPAWKLILRFKMSFAIKQTWSDSRGFSGDLRKIIPFCAFIFQAFTSIWSFTALLYYSVFLSEELLWKNFSKTPLTDAFTYRLRAFHVPTDCLKMQRPWFPSITPSPVPKAQAVVASKENCKEIPRATSWLIRWGRARISSILLLRRIFTPG